MNLTLHVWRQKSPGDEGRMGPISGQGRQRARLVPRDARRLERAARRARRGAGRLRARLPRGNLRLLRLPDQWSGARPPASHDRLPAPHAPLQGRRRPAPRALALESLSGAQGPGGRPRRLRPRDPGRRLHHRGHRQRPGSQHDPRPQAARRPRLRRRPVHRLRRLRRPVPERCREPLHLGESRASQPAPRKGRPNALSAPSAWSKRWRRKASATARTTPNARPSARRRSRSDFIVARMNRDYLEGEDAGGAEGGGGRGRRIATP